jgi:hypothetical protein
VILGITPFIILLSTARRAIGTADAASQPYLIAFVFTIYATLIAIFFGELFTPWPYFWAYAGLLMRVAVDANRPPIPAPIVARATKALAA